MHNGKPAYATNIIHYEGSEKTMDMKTLYTFNNDEGEIVFGTHIGTNSENNFIIELKGTGAIVVKSPKELEEVLPYTFSVDIEGKEIHYIGEPGKVSKGDWLLQRVGKGHLVVQVKAVDTKNKAARSKFSGRKLVTEEI